MSHQNHDDPQLRQQRLQRAVGIELRLLREAQGMSDAVAARDAGVTQTYLRNLEHGQLNVSIGQIKALATFYGEDLKALMGRANARVIAEEQGHHAPAPAALTHDDFTDDSR